jgi:hypothetical protein
MVPSLASYHFGAKKVEVPSKKPLEIADYACFDKVKKITSRIFQKRAVHWYFYVPTLGNNIPRDVILHSTLEIHEIPPTLQTGKFRKDAWSC